MSVASNFPTVIFVQDNNELQILDDHWRVLPLVEFDESIIIKKRPDAFRVKLSAWSDISENDSFQKLAKFAIDRLVSSHGSADCESVRQGKLGNKKLRNELATLSIDT